MKKKILFLLFLLFLFVFCFCGCGSTSAENPNAEPTKSVPTKVLTPTLKPEKTPPLETPKPTKEAIPTEAPILTLKPTEMPTPTGEKEFNVDTDYANLEESKGFVFESNGDGTCTLTKIGTCKDTDIVIPEKSPDGDTVTMIGEYAFYNAEGITSIIFIDKTMKLDKKAFYECSFRKLVISGCNLDIGEYAFAYSKDVSKIYISNSILDIDSYAFYECGKNIDTQIVNCSGTLEEKAFHSSYIVGLLIKDCTLELGEYAFAYCEDVNEIYISNSTVDIDSYAFYECGKNIDVQIVNCSGTLEEKAFHSSYIVGLLIKDCTLELGKYAFAYCEDITNITVENCTIKIGSYAFYEVGDDTVVTFKDCGLTMDDKAFYSCSLVSLSITGCETVMGEYTFSYCEDLESITIDANNTEIGSYSFYECTSLKNVEIASESEIDEIKIIIGDKSFQSCSVENVVIGRGIVKLGKYAFSYCEDLVMVEIKGNSLKVEKDAFYDCPDSLVITYNGNKYDKLSIENIK